MLPFLVLFVLVQQCVVVLGAGIPGIDRIWVLTLDVKERARLERTFDYLKISRDAVTWFPAVNGSVLGERYKRGLKTEISWSSLDFDKQGSINAHHEAGWNFVWKVTSQWQSYLGILAAFIKSGAEVGLMLEEDVDMTTDFVEKVAIVMKTVPRPWHVLRIGGCSEGPGRMVAPPYVHETTAFWCMHAIAFHRKLAPELFKAFDQPSLSWPNPDSFLHNRLRGFIRSPVAYSVFPHFITQTRWVEAESKENPTNQWVGSYIK